MYVQAQEYPTARLVLSEMKLGMLSRTIVNTPGRKGAILARQMFAAAGCPHLRVLVLLSLDR